MPLVPILIGAKIGLDLIQGASQTATQREIGSESLKINIEQMKSLDEARASTLEAYKQQKELITDAFGNQIESLSERTGLAGEQMSSSIAELESRVGLTKSGSVDVKRNMMFEDFLNTYKSGRMSILESYGSKLQELERWKASTIGTIEARQFAIRKEMAANKAQANSKFLGIF